jgi:hypothetical protein
MPNFTVNGGVRWKARLSAGEAMTRRNDAGGRAAETDGALQVMNASREPALLNTLSRLRRLPPVRFSQKSCRVFRDFLNRRKSHSKRRDRPFLRRPRAGER